MLDKIKKIVSSYELLKGNYGIEREALRVYKDGKWTYYSINKAGGEVAKDLLDEVMDA